MKTKNELYVWLIFFIITVINQSQIFAQGVNITLTEADKKIAPDFFAKEKLESVNSSSGTGVLSSIPNVNLISNINDTQANINFSINSGNRSIFNFGFSQSFSKKPKTAALIDLNGLNTGSTFSIGWQTFIGKQKIPDKLPLKNLKKFKEITEEFRNKDKNKGKFSDENEISWLDLDSEYKKKVIESGSVNLDNFATQWLFGIKFSASKLGFDYIPDSLSLKPVSEQKIDKNLTLSLSKFSNLDFFYSFSFSLLYNHLSGNDVINYLFPLGTQGLSYSKDVTIGVPKEKFDNKIKGEFRQLFRNKNFAPFLGINPSISLFTKREKINIDLPVYFLTKSDEGQFNGLQAGFKIGYTSNWNDSFIKDLFDFNSNKMYFSLFITKPFSVRN